MESLYTDNFTNEISILTARNRYRLSDGVITSTSIKVEKQKKVNLYSSPEQIDVLMTLEPAALKLWLYMAMTIGKGKHSIRLSRKKFKQVSGITSETTIRNAINQLIRYDLVRKESLNVYHINPHYICSGNRISMFKNSIKVVADLT